MIINKRGLALPVIVLIIIGGVLVIGGIFVSINNQVSRSPVQGSAIRFSADIFYSRCENQQCVTRIGFQQDQCSTNADCSCSDSDANSLYPNGRNPWVRGTARSGFNSSTDSCSTNIQLNEFYCSGANIIREGISCTNYGSGYTCQDGKCNAPPTCTNDCSPSGARQCSGNGYRICGYYDSDPCLEWSSVTSCPSGQTCSNGQCVVPPCTDTDGGINYFVRGTTSNANTSFTDQCSGSYLYEYYCANATVITSTRVLCTSLGNYQCQNGACIPTNITNTSMPDLIVDSISVFSSFNITQNITYIYAYIKNIGNAVAGQSTTRFNIIQTNEIVFRSTPSISPGGIASVYASSTKIWQGGTFTVFVNADWYNAVNESSEFNNVRNLTFRP